MNRLVNKVELMLGKRGEIPDGFLYTKNIRQERLIQPDEFTEEDLARCLGAAATKPAFSREYGEGFQVLMGDRADGNEFLVVKFLPVVLNNATNRRLPKKSPSVVTESGRWQNRSGILQPRPVGSKMVVERVEEIAALNRGKVKGLRFGGTSGLRLATLDVWSNREIVSFDQPSDTAKEIPDVLEEVEMLQQQEK